ncbi:Uncharacterised protein [Amycolatopsis camponoti]|uniref:Uncharacterized protein n=1 Tax=Amycolatopsis camponoti TaxID=2606593 RepID=A0A6I8LID2_9PSEU|nr:DUF6228 family protein [Amycolatopsis camponoti]VVJ15405.1 Uncharacterised protein [Amycolatopsis camponoti]
MTVFLAGPGVTLTLTDLDASEGDLVYFTARAEGNGLAASASVMTLHGDGLGPFTAGLERDFRGWSGERVWQSARADLGLRATHHGRAVELAWTLQGREPIHDETRPWAVTVRTFVTPGEELRTFGAEVAEFLAT